MLNYNKLPDPAASEKLLSKVFELFIEKRIDNTLIGFKGSGKTAYLKYLIRNLPVLIDRTKDKRVYGFINITTLNKSEDETCREFIQYIYNFSSDIIGTEATNNLKNIVQDQNIKVTFNLVSQILHSLTYDMGIYVTILIENMQELLRVPDLRNHISSISILKKINPMRVNFLTLSNSEFDDSDIDKLESLKTIFTHNYIWGRDLTFDEDSMQCMVKNQETWNNYKFSQEFIKKVYDISQYDPTVIKVIITKGLNDKTFEENIVETTDTNTLYNLIGKVTLDQRYKGIIMCLKKQSLNFLTHKSLSPTEYIEKTGLFISGNPMNALFAHYLKSNNKLIETLSDVTTSTNTYTPIDPEILDNLSGQELQTYKLLLENSGNMVLKENVAKTIWGDEWETKYSDWALDQLMSRLRTKLKSAKIRIKTIKGKGFLLVNF